MDKLFEKRVISGREIINPFRTKNSKEFLSNNLEHEVKTIIDRLFWIEEENKKLEEENRILRDTLSKFDDIKRRVNNMPYDEFLELLKHYNKWADDIKERAKYEPTEASCDFPRLKSSMAQFITRDEYFGSYKKKGQGE